MLLASLYFIVRTTTPDSPPRSHTKHHALSHLVSLFAIAYIARPKWCARSGAHHHLMMAQMDHTLNERTHSTVSADNAVIIQWIWSYFRLGRKKKEREMGMYSFICSYTYFAIFRWQIINHSKQNCSFFTP